MTPKPASGAVYGGGILVSFVLVIAVLLLVFMLGVRWRRPCPARRLDCLRRHDLSSR